MRGTTLVKLAALGGFVLATMGSLNTVGRLDANVRSLGVNKNLYVAPTIWTIEWAQRYYKYPITRSN